MHAKDCTKETVNIIISFLFYMCQTPYAINQLLTISTTSAAATTTTSNNDDSTSITILFLRLVNACKLMYLFHVARIYRGSLKP